MTAEELSKELSKIGWRISKSHNGLNDFIINDKGEETSFVILDGKLEVRKELFGSSFQGTFHFEIKNIKITEVKSNNKDVDGISLWITEDCFISFYNHNLNKK